MTQIRKLLCLCLSVLLMFSTVSMAVCASAMNEDSPAQQEEPMEAPEQEAETEPENDPLPIEYSEAAEPQEEAEEFEEEPVIEAPAIRDAYNNVPLFFQTDYPDVRYSEGTVATSGCSMASVAMVASYLTGRDIYPDEIAVRFRDYDASNMQKMEAASTVLDLKYTKTFEWDEVIEALQDGKVVTILVNDASTFTDKQHFLVLTGITAEGKILLNDSYGPNYQRPELIEGFNFGFSQGVVATGFSGAWIYEGYCPRQIVPTRYPGVDLTEEERELIAKVIYLEARGECFEGQQAIAEIILNRFTSDDFQFNSIAGVILAPKQFRTSHLLSTAHPGEIQYKALDCALNCESVIPKDVYFFASYRTNENVWGKIGGHIFCYAFD